MNKVIIASLLLLLSVPHVNAKTTTPYSLKNCQSSIIAEVKNKLLQNDVSLGEIDDTKTTLFVSNTTYHKDRKVAHQLYYIEYHTKAETTVPVFFETDIVSDGSCQRANSRTYLLTE